MPFLKDGSFLLDDSDCAPYGTTAMHEKLKNGKQEQKKNTEKKSDTKKKK